MTSVTEQDDPFIGANIGNRFYVEAFLAEGGMGRVYRARDRHSGANVAVKIVRDTAYDQRIASERLFREAEIVSSLRHESIVSLVDFGEDAALGARYLAMEYVEGESLGDVIRRGPLHWRVAFELAAQVAEALEVAHRAHVIHRDIKPDNVMLVTLADDTVRPVILDFGLALPQELTARLTAEGVVPGTAAYMAPEQARARELTPAADLYALGVLLFESITGVLPVDGKTPLDLVIRKLNEPAPDVRAVLPSGSGFPDAGARLIADLLQRDPSLRPGSATEVAARLHGVLGVERGTSTLRETDFTAATQGEMPLEPATSRSSWSERFAEVAPFVTIAAASLLVVTAVLHVVSSDDDRRHVEVPSSREPASPSPENAVQRADRQDDQSADPASSANEAVPVARDHAPDAAIEEVVAEGCGSEQAPGTRRHRVQEGGVRGDWLVHVPTNYDPTRRHPLLLLFHDSSLSPEYMLQHRRFRDLADERGLILVAPRAFARYGAWEARGDVELVLHAIEDTRRRLCVDPDTTLAVGNGSGGHFLFFSLVCKEPLTAMVTIAFRPRTSYTEYAGCEPIVDTPVMELVAEYDPGTPDEGGRNCVGNEITSRERYWALWHERNDCRPKELPWGDFDHGECVHFECRAAPFVSCQPEGGRSWAGEPHQLDRVCAILGSRTARPSRFPYTDAIWAFFSEVIDDQQEANK